MDDGLKQRIVGAIVLVAIAMIFLPMLFDDNMSNNGADETQIPPPPQVTDLASTKPDQFVEQIPAVETAGDNQQKTWKEQDQAPNAFDEESPAPDEPVSEAESTKPTATAVKIADNGLANAWTLQVGTFGDKANAQALSEKLTQKKYQSYVREIKDEKGSTFKVFVGPDTQRAHIEETMKKLLTIKQELHISGILLKPYQP